MSERSAVLGASAWQSGLLPVGETLSGRRVTELLGEVQCRIEQIVDGTRERMNALLRAVIAVSDGLDLDETLQQITRAAIDLVDARYGALGVLAEDGSLSKFIFLQDLSGNVEMPLEPLHTVGLASPATIPPAVEGLTLVDEAKRLLLDDLVKNPLSAGFTANERPTRRFLGVPVLARGEVFGRLYLTEKHRGAGLTEDDEIVVRALAAAAGIAVDNARMYEGAQRNRRWLEATAEVAARLLTGGDAHDALELIATHALRLAGADYTLIALPDGASVPEPDRSILTVTVCVGMGADTILGRTMPISGSTGGEVFADRVPRNVTELSYDLAVGLGVEFGPALALPLGSGDALAGVLLAVRTPGSPAFDDLEMQLVSLFAGQAMLALDRAEVQTARRELQALTDRDRIAQDLHDHVIQRLFAVGLAMESTQQSSKVPSVTGRLSAHVDEVYEVISEIRSAIFDLQAEPARADQLRTTLHHVITDLTADTPLRATVRMSGPLDSLPASLRQQLQAVLREAVSNVVRHAKATEVTVTISVDDIVAIDVTDNGVGIPDTAARSGLHNLQHRASSAGGSCTVTRLDAGGTRLNWSAPLLIKTGPGETGIADS